MEPSEKSPEMEQALTEMFGFDRRKFIVENKCVMCGLDAVEFKDELSKREFAISGLCQLCQNKVFTTDDTCDGEALMFDENGNACNGFCDDCNKFSPKDWGDEVF